MERRQPLSIVAIFGKDYTDADLNLAQGGLMKMGFELSVAMKKSPVMAS